VAVLSNPLLNCKKLNNAYAQVYAIYASKIRALIVQQIKDEDIEGTSNLPAGTMQYQQAFLLVIIFYNDVLSGDYTLEYLLEFYKIAELRACFRCIGIDLKLLFDTIGIDILAVTA